MRPRNLWAAAALALAAVLLSACASRGAAPAGGSATPTGSQLAPRTVTAGAVEVAITPVRIDASGAVLGVKFDTHAVELGMDLPSAAHLSVGGKPWPRGSWQGPGPGGHHREGTLSFDAAGPATGQATLTIEGLPAPVEVSWTLAGS